MEPDEFAEAFRAAARALWCVASGVLGRAEGAEDVLQEAAVTALAKLDDFEPGTSFTAWMSTIVRYTALNHARRRARSPIHGTDPDVLAAIGVGGVRPGAGATPVASDGRLRDDQAAFDDAVAGALGRLEPVPRACLLLRISEGLSYRDIARVLDVPEGTAMSHVHRARAALRRWLGTDDDADAGPAPRSASKESMR